MREKQTDRQTDRQRQTEKKINEKEKLDLTKHKKANIVSPLMVTTRCVRS